MKKIIFFVLISGYLIFSCKHLSPEGTVCKSETKGQIIVEQPLLYHSILDEKPIEANYLTGKYFYICTGEYLKRNRISTDLLKGFYIIEGTQTPSNNYYIRKQDLYFFNVRMDAPKSYFNGVWTNRRLYVSFSPLTYKIDIHNSTLTYVINGDCQIEDNEVVCFDNAEGSKSEMYANFIYKKDSIKGRFYKLLTKGASITLTDKIINLDFELYRCNENAICNNNGIALIRN